MLKLLVHGGNEAVVIVIAELTLIVRLFVPIPPTESVAVTRNVKLPAAVGVPVRAPALLKEIPGGKLALTVENVIVPVPPDVATDWEYDAKFAVHGGTVVVVTVTAGLIVTA